MVYGAKNAKKSNKKNKSLNKSKIIKLIITIVFILIIIALCIMYSTIDQVKLFTDKYIFRKNTYENKLPTITIDTSTVSNFYAYNKNILILNQNTLNIYDKYGNNLNKIDIEISKPIFESNDKFLCVAEKGDKKIYLIEGKNIVWQRDLEGNILDVNVNKNGYVSVVLTGTSHKTVVETYDNKGEQLFKTHLSTSNVIDTDISNDNKYLAIAEANFTGVFIQSNIKIISIDKAKTGSSESIIYEKASDAGNLIININYNSKNDLICMYDNYIGSISNNDELKITQFNEKTIFANIDLDTAMIEIINQSDGILKREIVLSITDNVNESKKTYIIADNPKEIYAKDNIIAINLGTEVLFVNDNAWLVKKYESNQEIQKVILSGDLAGIIYKDKIELISL